MSLLFGEKVFIAEAYFKRDAKARLCANARLAATYKRVIFVPLLHNWQSVS